RRDAGRHAGRPDLRRLWHHGERALRTLSARRKGLRDRRRIERNPQEHDRQVPDPRLRPRSQEEVGLMRNLSAKLLARAHELPEAPAVLWDEGTLNWSELADLSLRMSTRLRERGIAPGDHVALMCSNRPAYLVIWF